jgi:hypothetical protein
MHSTLPPKPSDDPHDFVVVPPDAVRVAPDAVQVVPEEDELSSLLHQAARHRPDAQTRAAVDFAADPTVPPVDTTFRPAAVDDILGSGHRRSFGRRLARAFAALLLAACIGAAAIAWQTFGYAGKKMIVKWTPQFIMTSLSLEKWGLPAQSASPGDEADAANAVAQTSADSAAANPAAQPPEPAQTLQSMARDLASVGQEVEQLKASIAELKASQQQLSRELAKASENKAPVQTARPRMSAIPPPPPPVARPRKPASPYVPTPAAASPTVPQAARPYAAQAAQPQAAQPYLSPQPAQLPAEPGFASAPRPPMPVQ